MGTAVVLLLESLRSPRIEHLSQLLHLMNNGRKFRIMRRTSCSSLSRVLSTRSSQSTSPTSPTSLSQDYDIFLLCVQQQYTDVSLLLARAMWKSPIPQAMTAKQWQKINRTRAKVTVSHRPLCCVDFTCLNCFRQTHFASAVEHEFVDPDVECVLSWRRVSCEQQQDTFQSCCQFCGNQSATGMHLKSAF